MCEKKAFPTESCFEPVVAEDVVMASLNGVAYR